MFQVKIDDLSPVQLNFVYNIRINKQEYRYLWMLDDDMGYEFYNWITAERSSGSYDKNPNLSMMLSMDAIIKHSVNLLYDEPFDTWCACCHDGTFATFDKNPRVAAMKTILKKTFGENESFSLSDKLKGL